MLPSTCDSSNYSILGARQSHADQQSEKHDGPHADHFWDVQRSGGGVLMDMGCHAIAFFRWMLGDVPIRSVYAHCRRRSTVTGPEVTTTPC